MKLVREAASELNQFLYVHSTDNSGQCYCQSSVLIMMIQVIGSGKMVSTNGLIN